MNKHTQNKSAKVTVSPAITLASIKRILWRHHFTLFLVISVGGIALAISSLFGVINSSENVTNVDTSGQISFDQTTIDNLEKLKGTSTSTTYSLPTNQRIDPFVEGR